MLRFRHRMRPRELPIYPGGGQEARLVKLRQLVSGLIRYERIEPSYAQADEARQYAERLIYLAIKNGDQHKETMEVADFWLLEKDLIHKLFKVLVPRYENHKSCYTDLHKLAVEYPGSGSSKAVLELRGNPWPPIIARHRDTKYLLTNVLMSAAKYDYYSNKNAKSQQNPFASMTEEKPLSSSVDPAQEPMSGSSPQR